ncbi:MAG: RNase adapter RapZ [Oscillospiraceae bacterium]|nr:RNase adapter RapZ [Oscillospiraceae bacterium]
MELVILTGLSGSGKGRAKSILSDMGYYCVDNPPPEMICAMAEYAAARGGRYEKMALSVDSRGCRAYEPVLESLRRVEAMGVKTRILYLEADAAYIIRRYKETRRRHPLDDGCPSLEDAIEAERRLLAPMREHAEMTLDATGLSANQLTEKLSPLFGPGGAAPEMRVEVRSFGFMRGLPPEADLVFDVRFLPNPFYVRELKALTGRDAPVSDYVLNRPEAREFLERLFALVDYLIPQYRAESRQKLVAAVGCTGGKHRSVAVAEALAAHISAHGVCPAVLHRDIQDL